MKKLLFLLFTALFLQACGSNPVVQKPQISVQDVKLHDLSLRQGTAMVSLNVANPNVFPMPIRGVQYNLTINGLDVAKGVQNSGLNIGARQQSTINIPVSLQFRELSRLLPTIWRDRKVDYSLNGAVQLPLISVPFSKNGGLGVNQ